MGPSKGVDADVTASRGCPTRARTNAVRSRPSVASALAFPPRARKPAACDEAREGDPLLGQDPKHSVARAPERDWALQLSRMPASLCGDGCSRGRSADQRRPWRPMHGEQCGRRGHEKRNGHGVHEEIAPVSMAKRVKGELPGQKPAGAIGHAFTIQSPEHGARTVRFAVSCAEVVRRLSVRHRGLVGLHAYGGSVGEYFGDPRGDFGRVVSHGDDGVRAKSPSVIDHDAKRILTSLLTKFAVDRDIATEDHLKPGDEIPNDRSRANDDAAYDAEVLHDTKAVDAIGGRDEGGARVVHWRERVGMR
jgi:hypothetical protein